MRLNERPVFFSFVFSLILNIAGLAAFWLLEDSSKWAWRTLQLVFLPGDSVVQPVSHGLGFLAIVLATFLNFVVYFAAFYAVLRTAGWIRSRTASKRRDS